MKPAAEDITNRCSVWVALSDLFLDTELQPSNHENIATILAESPYTSEEIEDILYDEVYPICIWNLRSVAGEWAGIDGDWLQSAILKRSGSLWRAPRFLQMGHWMIRSDWEKVKILFRYRRQVPGQAAT